MQFFHGSKNGSLKELTTNHSRDGYIYATSSRIVALTYAARVMPNLFSSFEGKECFWDLKDGLFEKMTKNKSGYIYVLEDKSFEPIPQSKNCGHQNCYRVRENVRVVKKEFIKDFYDELQKYIENGEFVVMRNKDIPPEKRTSMIAGLKECIKTLSNAELNDENNFWKMFL